MDDAFVLFSNSSYLYIFRYARQVAEFFEFVKRRKEDSPPETEKKNGSQQIMLPEGGLWVPNGSQFPHSALGLWT